MDILIDVGSDSPAVHYTVKSNLRGNPTMKVPAYHTTNPEHRNVYHDHDDCKDGKRILAADKVAGTGGRPRCQECIRLG